uniref:Rhomboid protease gluP n=1 Tax=Anthurium amnicola TaxID=1678845 RepID=A0A1D1Y7K0_9ARAE
MTAAPLFSMVILHDSIQPTIKSSLHCGIGTITENLLPSQKAFRCFSSSGSCSSRKRSLALCNHSELLSKTRMKKWVDDHVVNNRRSMPFPKFTEVHSWNNCAMDKLLKSSSNGISQIDKPFLAPYLSATGCNGRQLKPLDSYCSKLLGDMNEEHTSCMPASDFETLSDTRKHQTDPSSRLGQKMRSIEKVDQLKAEIGLGSLESYFEKLSGGMQTRETTSLPSSEDDGESSLIRLNVISEENHEKNAGAMNTHNNRMPLENMDDETVPVMFGQNNFQDSQPYDDTPDFRLINFLASIDIAVFLFEIASPIRSSAVEQLSLPLIYGAKINKLILDGEWWRILTPMFLGPVFAIIGAWLIYQLQNKEAIAKEVSENLFWKAVVATSLSFLISNFEQVDEWSHLGAAFSGLVYGFLTCPTTYLDRAPPERSKEEGIALVKQQADPCKSAAIFTVSIFILCSLVFVLDAGFDLLELDDLL